MIQSVSLKQLNPRRLLSNMVFVVTKSLFYFPENMEEEKWPCLLKLGYKRSGCFRAFSLKLIVLCLSDGRKKKNRNRFDISTQHYYFLFAMQIHHHKTSKKRQGLKIKRYGKQFIVQCQELHRIPYMCTILGFRSFLQAMLICK